MKNIVVYGVLILSSGTVFADNSVYVSGNFGVAIPMTSELTVGGQTIGNIKSNSGFSVAGAVGYEFDNMRIEAEVNYQQNTLKSISNGSNSANLKGSDTNLYSVGLLTNIYYDFKNNTDFTPYISSGIGFADVWLGGPSGASKSNFVFAYQAGVGLDYAINDKIDIGVKYRYFGTTGIEDRGSNLGYSSNNIYAGMRFNF